MLLIQKKTVRRLLGFLLVLLLIGLTVFAVHMVCDMLWVVGLIEDAPEGR
jgi:hypothetical protein